MTMLDRIWGAKRFIFLLCTQIINTDRNKPFLLGIEPGKFCSLMYCGFVLSIFLNIFACILLISLEGFVMVASEQAKTVFKQ